MELGTAGALDVRCREGFRAFAGSGAPLRRRISRRPAVLARGNSIHSSLSTKNELTPCTAWPCLPSNLISIGIGVAAAGVFWGLRSMRLQHLQKSSSSDQPKRRQSAAQVYHFAPNKDYVVALAHTRQAAHVERALGFQAEGEPARAMAELGRALAENRGCRQPFMTTSCTQQQHMEDPTDYATLLQLRTMLNIPNDKGEEVEREVAEQAGAFCI